MIADYVSYELIAIVMFAGMMSVSYTHLTLPTILLV